jgi:predicted nuclease of predicted toxin-antitoxin system
VPLALYLDDCAYSKKLVRLLTAAGHTVVVPAEAGLTGRDDAAHFAYACEHGLIVVTRNAADFHALHEQTLARAADHPGVFAVYQDNNPNRDMSYQEIVAAIGRLEATWSASGQSLGNNFHTLNAWRVPAPPAPDPG